MVDVPDRAHVHVRLGSLEYFLCHVFFILQIVLSANGRASGTAPLRKHLLLLVHFDLQPALKLDEISKVTVLVYPVGLCPDFGSEFPVADYSSIDLLLR
jgi:hypothetical protein